MNFPSDVPITPAKLASLRARLARLGIALDKIDEQAVKCSGPGGQKVNKTASGVLLRYGPTPSPSSPLGAAGEVLVVKCARERHRSLNRFLALRELADRAEAVVSPQTSARLREQQRLRKQKDRTRRRRAEAPQ
jgi:protein subunit release factor B